jgi:hypothetical protein
LGCESLKILTGQLTAEYFLVVAWWRYIAVRLLVNGFKVKLWNFCAGALSPLNLVVDIKVSVSEKRYLEGVLF